MSLAIFLLLFASGFSSLLYQVLWAREFGVILGNTVHAISTVLAAFMGGLGLGSIWLGSRMDRTRWHPLKVYGALEIGIALAALFVQGAIIGLPLVYGPIYNLREIPGLFYAIRFALIFSILLLPTFLMGGTLPAVAKYFIRQNRSGTAAGWIYGWNTVGAAAGAVAAGFFLIEQFGMTLTLAVAIATNVFVGIVSLVLSERETTPAGQPLEAASVSSSKSSVSVGTIAYAVSGFVALGLEVAWSRTLVFAIGSTTYAFSLMLVVLLAGLAVGSVIASQILRRTTRPFPWLIAGQISVAVLSLFSLWLYAGASSSVREWFAYTDELPWNTKLLVQFLQAAFLMAPPAVIFGALFPLAADMAVGSHAVASGVGRLLGANTLASIAGSLLTGFLFIPAFGIQGAYTLLATVGFLGFVYVLGVSFRWKVAAGLVLVWILLIGTVPMHRTLEPLLPIEKLLFYKEGTNGTISVVEDYSGDRRLLIDHIAVAGTDLVFTTDQKSLAHLPMLLHPNPKKVLTVGFGSGGASYSFSRYPLLEAIHAVEIDPAVLEAAPYFKTANGNVLEDPRFRVIRDDARSYVLHARETYDIITTDCTDLRYKSNALLYTQEFFEAARQRLNAGGMLVAWVPLGGLSTEDLKVVIRTFTVVFPHSTAWYMYNYPTHYLLLVGSSRAIEVSLDRVQERMAIPAVQKDLAEIDLNDSLKFLTCYLKDHAQLVAFSGNSGINSDERPYLEFSVPQKGFLFSIAENLEAFVRETSDPTRLVSKPADLEAILGARSLILQGHIVFNRGNNQYRSAAGLYERARMRHPADRSLDVLIRATLGMAKVKKEGVEKLVTLNEADFNTYTELGLLLEDEGDLDGALRALQKALELAPARPALHLNAGRIFDKKRLWEESITEYQAALRLDPGYADAWNNLGFVYLEQERYEQALDAFEKAAASRPDRAVFWFNLGLAAFRSGDMVRARVAYDRAIQLNPVYAEAYLNRGILRLRNNDVQGAFSDLQLTLQHRPDYAEAHYNLGIIEEQQGRLTEAVFHYRRAIELDSNHVLAHNNLGILYSVAGQTRLAIETYLKAVSIDPQNPQLRNNLGMEYARMGNFPRAIVEYETAIRLRPQMFEPYANLALIYLRQNQRAKADEYVALARKINPRFRLP